MSANKKPETEEANKEFLATFARGLAVIKSFDRKNSSMTLSDVAKRNGISRASARRFLLTLEHLGYVDQKGREFRLTAKVLELGGAFLETFDTVELITPYLEKVCFELKEACSASILDGEDIVYIARIRAGSTPLNLQVGERLPAYATSAGRVLLAALPSDLLDNILDDLEFEQLTPYTINNRHDLLAEIARVKNQNYAIVEQELTLGLSSLAVPVFNRNGKAVLCINISLHSSRFKLDEIVDKYVPVLHAASRKISERLP